MKVLVLQHGARRRYAVPRILYAQGRLAGLYTDSSRHSMLGKVAQWLAGAGPKSLSRLAERMPEGIPAELVRSSDGPWLNELSGSLRGAKPTELTKYAERSRVLSRKMKRWGLRGAQIVYSMNRENLDFVEWSKTKGVLSVVDVFISPLAEGIMRREMAQYPELARRQEGGDDTLSDQLWRRMGAAADVLLCPSRWVADGVCTVMPEQTDKIAVVPYGSSITQNASANRPEAGRILFVGGDPVRKGLRYLAEAGEFLREEGVICEVRVAGKMPAEIIKSPRYKELNFIGKLSNAEMVDEYAKADIFVLPSLAEGFAGVVAEAVAAGCPVVVTMETGAPVVDGREGLIVPARDSKALARAVRKIVSDRKLRDAMAASCLENKEYYSLSSWGDRLGEVLDGLGAMNKR